MYVRFTDRARKTMQLANREAQRWQHEYIGTEHVLLGLIGVGTGVAADTLKKLGVDVQVVRLEVEKLMVSGPETIRFGKYPCTPRAKKVIAYAMEEARGLNHNCVGSEHILLGLVRDEEGVAGQVLSRLGLTLEQARAEVRILVPGEKDDYERLVPPGPSLLQIGLCVLVAVAVGAMLAVIFFWR